MRPAARERNNRATEQQPAALGAHPDRALPPRADDRPDRSRPRGAATGPARSQRRAQPGQAAGREISARRGPRTRRQKASAALIRRAARPAGSPGRPGRAFAGGRRAVQSSRVPAPPATRTTSLTDSTTRDPSGRRAWCTTRSSALATWSRIAACGSPTPAISASVSIRRSASARRVRVHGRQRAVVSGVERLQHVERLGAAHLPHHDPVRPHPQRVRHQLPDRHLAAPLDVRRPRLQPHHVPLAQAQLGRVLDRHDPLLAGDRARQRAERRRLARPGPAAHQHRRPRRHAQREQLGHLPGSVPSSTSSRSE